MTHLNATPVVQPTQDKQAHELTFEQFASLATVTALANHGRRWKVELAGSYSSFADGPAVEDALRDAHSGAVNNALYFNTPDAPCFGQKPTIPPATVLAQYPDVVARFPELGLGTGNVPSQAAGLQMSMSL